MCIIRVQNYYYYSGDPFRISSLFNVLINRLYILPAAFLLIPTIGVFLKRKIGWILMISYFYFLITNILYNFSTDYINDYWDIIFESVISGLVALLLVVMNKKSIYSSKYNIQREKLIIYNIIAFTIGVSMNMYLAYTGI